MKIRIKKGLPYISASLIYKKRKIEFNNVLLDTGSAGSVFSADKLLSIGLSVERDDSVHRIMGVGGAEFVFSKRIDSLAMEKFEVNDVEIEVGAMDYGIDIDGIIGMDFLLQARAKIDFEHLEIELRA